MSYGNTFERCLLVSIALSFYVVPEVHGGFACLSNPCVHGVCLDDLNTTYSCYCIDGYTGVQCQTNWDECWSSPCRNGGVCIDGIATFNCSCPAGYVGELCEEDFNECDSNPCQNNGTCTDVLNGYNCTCIPGYSGIHCEIDIAVCNATNETRCSNGGVCVEGPGVSFECKCRPGWGGFLCETEIDECMSAPCLNGAVCIDLHADYACACLFGYTGRNCEEQVHVCEGNPCRNGALCLMEDGHATCYCVPDFHGDLCQYQYDECQLGPRCFNGGTCIDGIDNFTCSCPPKLTGVFCECLIVDSSTLDCSYISSTSITFASSSFPTTESTTTTLAAATTTTKTEIPTTLETLISEITEVPNASTTLYYSSETTTAPISYPSTVVASFSTETTSGSSEITVSEVTTETFVETTWITQEVPHSTKAIENVTTTEVIHTTTPPELPQTTTETTVVLTASTEKATEEPYSTEVTTYHYDSTSSTIQLSARTLETSVATATMETTELLTIPLTLLPNVTQTLTTFFSAETTVSYVAEETTLLSSIVPFLTDVPTTTEEFVPLTFTLPEMNQTTTTAAAADCSSGETPCQNGGTCVYTTEGYTCVCPFDAEGRFCEVHLGIKNAAFGGDSFLSHRLVNHTSIWFDFKARTLSSEGLVFYTNVDSTYVMLYLEKGYLMFKFSCGYQTMLLSELDRPVNNGFDMHIRTKLDFTKDLKFCNASISINNTLTMAGNQVAIINKLTKPEVWLYMGGVPQDVVKNNGHTAGFVGCMRDLKILGKPINIFKDAEDGFEITECSSLVCLSNPCRNEATCAAMNDSWTCHCKNGYLGAMCELSVCDNNPCLFGGTCLPFTSSGYICLCPFGKHGHFCENDLEITEPNFSSTVHGLSSYAAYPIPSGISQSMEIRFKFIPTTMDQISILMFLGQKGQHDLFSDHMAVSFVKGYVMLTWNLGSGPRRIFTTRPVSKNQESYLVRFGHLGRRAWLFVDDLGNVTGRTPGNLVQLDVFPLLYLGGHDSLNFSTLPHDLPLHVGFSGCIFDVQLKSGSVLMPLQVTKQVTGRAVGQCETTECYERVCHNEGACLHHGSTFMCLCQDGWFGPLCSSRHNPCDSSMNNCSSGSTCFPQVTGYECDCPVGKTGKFCEVEQNLTDVSFTGRRSFLSLGPMETEPRRFNIEFQLRPLTNRGIVLFVGRQISFLCLLLHSSFLELTLLAVNRKGSSEEPLTIRSNKILALGNWYKIQIGIYGRKVYLAVDNVLNTGLLGTNEVLSIVGEDYYLGGLPDMSILTEVAIPSLPVAFTGCLRLLSINSNRIALSKENIKSARNIADCDGTPCGGDFCENGGSCWLDSNLNPLCLCQNPYFGDRCEKIPECGGLMCNNGGRCLNSRCICSVGWTGVYCETAIEVKQPKFKGSSYLIVETNMDKKRGLNDLKITSLYLNFSTPQRNGLIVWSSKGKNFVGVGTERGYLKFSYSSSKANQSVIEMLSVGQINDGLWHTLLIVFKPFYCEFDDNVIHLQNNKEVEISTDGLFYLGGMNNKQSLVVETSGMFNKPFQGCIDAFGLNDEEPITDFTRYEGENVDVCGLF